MLQLNHRLRLCRPVNAIAFGHRTLPYVRTSPRRSRRTVHTPPGGFVICGDGHDRKQQRRLPDSQFSANAGVGHVMACLDHLDAAPDHHRPPGVGTGVAPPRRPALDLQADRLNRTALRPTHAIARTTASGITRPSRAALSRSAKRRSPGSRAPLCPEIEAASAVIRWL